MTNNPNFINLDFSSFKEQKNQYKPPSNNFFVFQKPQNNQNTKKFVPSGEWADDNDNQETLNKNNNTNNEPKFSLGNVEEKKETKKFSFITNKNKVKKDDKNSLLSLDSIKSSTQGLIHEIIQPAGVIKRPQESMLKNFLEKAKNFETNVVYSILYHTLKQQSLGWISKLRALYCIDYLLKNKKYFVYIKTKQDIFNDIGMEQLKNNNASGFKNMDKLLKEIQGKLTKDFDKAQNKNDDFNFERYEEMKEQNNKQFFDMMENLNVNKETKQPEQQKPQQNSNNFLDIDFMGQNNEKEKSPIKDQFDLFKMNEPQQQNKQNDIDLLGVSSQQQQQKQPDDFLNLFQQINNYLIQFFVIISC